MTGRVFTPKGAVCGKCDLPMGFIELPNGKWRPCNPDGSDHWDVCRDVRYAKAKSGELREVTKRLKDPARTETIWFWDGGRKPFLVRHSIVVHGVGREVPGAGVRPQADLEALAMLRGYCLTSYLPDGSVRVTDGRLPSSSGQR